MRRRRKKRESNEKFPLGRGNFFSQVKPNLEFKEYFCNANVSLLYKLLAKSGWCLQSYIVV